MLGGREKGHGLRGFGEAVRLDEPVAEGGKRAPQEPLGYRRRPIVDELQVREAGVTALVQDVEARLDHGRHEQGVSHALVRKRIDGVGRHEAPVNEQRGAVKDGRQDPRHQRRVEHRGDDKRAVAPGE